MKRRNSTTKFSNTDGGYGMRLLHELGLGYCNCDTETIAQMGKRIRAKKTFILGKVGSQWHVSELIEGTEEALRFCPYYQVRGERITNLRRRAFSKTRAMQLENEDDRNICDLSRAELFRMGKDWAVIRKKAPKTGLQAKVMYGNFMENY